MSPKSAIQKWGMKKKFINTLLGFSTNKWKKIFINTLFAFKLRKWWEEWNMIWPHSVRLRTVLKCNWCLWPNWSTTTMNSLHPWRSTSSLTSWREWWKNSRNGYTSLYFRILRWEIFLVSRPPASCSSSPRWKIGTNSRLSRVNTSYISKLNLSILGLEFKSIYGPLYQETIKFWSILKKW